MTDDPDPHPISPRQAQDALGAPSNSSETIVGQADELSDQVIDLVDRLQDDADGLRTRGEARSADLLDQAWKLLLTVQSKNLVAKYWAADLHAYKAGSGWADCGTDGSIVGTVTHYAGPAGKMGF